MARFDGIGKISDYTQLRNLQRAMKYRIKTGQSLAQAMGSPVPEGRMCVSDLQRAREKTDANREQQIRQKLRQGQKLSATDMKYLKENNPDLYEKVLRIEEQREMLARALKRAKTKDEAQRAVAQANLSVFSEMQKGGGELPSTRGAGSGAEGAAGSPVMTAGGTPAAGDALDASAGEGADAAPTTGEMQGALGREALGAEPRGTLTAQPRAVQDGGDARADGAPEDPHRARAGFEQRSATCDPYGNRRVFSPEEMDDMLRTAQEQSRLSPLDNEKVYLLRALQREWMEYANSEEYKHLPNTAPDAAAEEAHGVRRKKNAEEDGTRTGGIAPSAAVFAAAHTYYHAAHGSKPFEAKG